jgi:hypothetical protein
MHHERTPGRSFISIPTFFDLLSLQTARDFVALDNRGGGSSALPTVGAPVGPPHTFPESMRCAACVNIKKCHLARDNQHFTILTETGCIMLDGKDSSRVRFYHGSQFAVSATNDLNSNTKTKTASCPHNSAYANKEIIGIKLVLAKPSTFSERS